MKKYIHAPIYSGFTPDNFFFLVNAHLGIKKFRVFPPMCVFLVVSFVCLFLLLFSLYTIYLVLENSSS
jgi:hypothetical protein